MENMYSGKSDTNPNKPLYIGLLVGLGLIAFSFFIYSDLAAWENTNEEKRLHWIIWGIYDVGGKLAVAGVFSAIGIGSILAGAVKTKGLKKLKEETKF